MDFLTDLLCVTFMVGVALIALSVICMVEEKCCEPEEEDNGNEHS